MWQDVEDREDILALLERIIPALLREYPDHVYIGSHEGELLYLRKPSWDCGWYWSLGYVVGLEDDGTFTHYRDVETQICKNEDEFFGDTFVLRRHSREWWRFTEIMRSLYHLKEQAEFWCHGNSYVSQNNCEEVLIDSELYKRINFVLIPLLVDELYKVLGY